MAMNEFEPLTTVVDEQTGGTLIILDEHENTAGDVTIGEDGQTVAEYDDGADEEDDVYQVVFVSDLVDEAILNPIYEDVHPQSETSRTDLREQLLQSEKRLNSLLEEFNEHDIFSYASYRLAPVENTDTEQCEPE
jgi:hypothetical protein